MKICKRIALLLAVKGGMMWVPKELPDSAKSRDGLSALSEGQNSDTLIFVICSKSTWRLNNRSKVASII